MISTIKKQNQKFTFDRKYCIYAGCKNKDQLPEGATHFDLEIVYSQSGTPYINMLLFKESKQE
jgi:hypothetical protein